VALLRLLVAPSAVENVIPENTLIKLDSQIVNYAILATELCSLGQQNVRLALKEKAILDLAVHSVTHALKAKSRHFPVQTAHSVQLEQRESAQLSVNPAQLEKKIHWKAVTV